MTIGLSKTCLAVMLAAGIGGLLAWELPRAEAYLFVPNDPNSNGDPGNNANPGDTNDPPDVEHAPEPATLLTGLIGGGLAGFYAIRRRRKNASTDGAEA